LGYSYRHTLKKLKDFLGLNFDIPKPCPGKDRVLTLAFKDKSP